MAYECWKLADIPGTADERLAGYRDAMNGDPMPGDNQPPGYHHGWWNGAVDFGRIEKPDWMAVLAAEFLRPAPQAEGEG